MITAACIAAGGVVLSAFISYFVSSKNFKLELRKYEEQIAQNVGQRIFEKRIDTYPQLYSIVCRYARDLKQNTMSITKLQEYYKKMVDWDVNNSIFMSATTHHLFWLLRVELLGLSRLTENEYKDIYDSDASTAELRETSYKVELALKNELGIFAFESPDRIRRGLEIDSFTDLNLHATGIEKMKSS